MDIEEVSAFLAYHDGKALAQWANNTDHNDKAEKERVT